MPFMKELVEVLTKDQSIFPLVIISSILIDFSLTVYEYSWEKIDVDHLKDLKGYITVG